MVEKLKLEGLNETGKHVGEPHLNHKKNDESKILETDSERRDRMISLLVVYFTLFLQAFGVAITMTGIWPFLDKLDPTAGKQFSGIVVAAYPLGQFIFSPIIGFWMNHSPSIRMSILTTLILFTVSSVFYSSLDLFGDNVKYWMILARFIMGASSANVAVCRSYIAAASTLDERTFALSMASLAQACGFIFGPLLQAAFTPLKEGFKFFGIFTFSIFTVGSWMNVLLGVINMIVFLTPLFKDHNIAVREQMLSQGKENAEETWKSIKIDYIFACSLIFSFSIVSFNLIILETLGTPLTMDQLAFSNEDALKWNNIFVGIGALIACLLFGFLPKLCKVYREINILIWGGLLTMVLGKLLFIPMFRYEMPQNADEFNNYSMIDETDGFLNKTQLLRLGCPVRDQPWCSWTPRLGIPEIIIGYFLSVIGFPFGVALIQSLFSKMLGARPQGTWMGIMSATGSISGIIGPIIIIQGYTRFGTLWTFSVITIIMLTPMILLLGLKHRIEKKPYKT